MKQIVAAVLSLCALPGWAAPPEPADVLHIPPELKAELRERVIDPGRTPAHRFDLLVSFMFDADQLAFEYDDTVTRTIAETYGDRRGNCLSFTLLFVALAREAGIDAYGQEVERVSAWYRDGNVVFNSRHANAGVRLPTGRQTIDFDRSVSRPRNRPHRVSDERVLAHFYNNRGAELLAAGALDEAKAHLDQAIALDANYAASWNNLGVLFLRAEDDGAAETAFLAALAREPEHAPTLSNLARLYEALGQEDRIAEFQQRLDTVQQGDPFYQFMLGQQSEDAHEYARALEHYRRAVRLHFDEHEFHFGLARMYHRMGQHRQSERALRRALRLSEDPSLHDLYAAKLRSLES